MTSQTEELQNLVLDRVPTELWSEIFHFAAPQLRWETWSNPTNLHSLNPNNTLHIIDKVCSTWRETVRSLPSLWSAILLPQHIWDIPDGAKEDPSLFVVNQLRIFSDILSRSQDQPLTILVQSPVNPDPSPLLEPIMSMLAQHSHRWRRLAIGRLDSDGTNKLKHGLASSLSRLGIDELPSLEVIGLDISRWLDPPDFLEFTKQDCKLPKLCSARFTLDSPLPDAFPYEQLKSIMLVDTDISQHRQILPLLRCAESVVVRSENWALHYLEHPTDDVVPHFTLPAMELFYVQGWDELCMAVMTAPNLTEIEIHELAGKHLRCVTDFIDRSQCSIEKFRCYSLLSHVPFATDDINPDIPAFLASVPHLQVLLFDWVPESNIETLLELLCKREPDGRMTYCPVLQDLTVLCYGFANQHSLFSRFLDMLETRTLQSEAGSSPLLHAGGIPVWNTGEFPEEYSDLYPRVNELGMEGLKITYCRYDTELEDTDQSLNVSD